MGEYEDKLKEWYKECGSPPPFTDKKGETWSAVRVSGVAICPEQIDLIAGLVAERIKEAE